MKLKITIDEKTYEVDVEAVEPEPTARRGYAVESSSVRVAAAPPAPAAPVDSGPVNEEKVCRSPVTGMAVKVTAQPGQRLQVGDILLILEAMKMETNITAPVAGKVKAVHAEQGGTVQAGQVVVEFE